MTLPHASFGNCWYPITQHRLFPEIRAQKLGNIEATIVIILLHVNNCISEVAPGIMLEAGRLRVRDQTMYINLSPAVYSASNMSTPNPAGE
jgi:hypothetical protein